MILTIAGVSAVMFLGFFILTFIFDCIYGHTYGPISEIVARFGEGMRILAIIMLVTALLMALLHLIMTFMSIATIVGAVLLVALPLSYLIGKFIRRD